VVIFTPRPLYPWGKRPRYFLDRRLGGPQSWSGRGDVEKTSLPGSKPSRPALSVVTILTELPQLRP
jgi:hypothetical protein